MFKFFVSLALVAAASAALYHNDEYITVNRDGSYLQINSQNGFRVAIVKNRYAGQEGLKNFDITLTGNNFYKNLHLENQVGGDVVFDLLARYQGEVDAVTFQQILTRIQEFVQEGKVHPHIFYMLLSLQNVQYTSYLTNNYGIEGMYGSQGLYGHQGLYGKQGFYGQHGIYGNQGLYGHQGLYGQGYYNKYGLGPIHAQSGIWSQIMHKQPYWGGFNDYHHGYNGVNQIVDQVAHQVENQIENEVEQEVEHKVGHPMGFYGHVGNQMGFYGQKVGDHMGFYGQGLYPYGQQGVFGSGYNKFHGGLYGQTPYHYNNIYNVMKGVYRYPTTVY